jgi:hypothetical protein
VERRGRDLGRLRDESGDRFIAGVALHTGPQPYALGDRLSAFPMGALWA